VCHPKVAKSMSPACVCLQDKVSTLVKALWDDAEAAANQSNIANLLHLAVNVQEPSVAVAMLRSVKHLRQQLVNRQRLQQQLQEAQQIAGVTRGSPSNVAKQQRNAQLVAQLQQRLQEFDRQVNAAETEQLLATAVARMHSAVVEQLSLLPAAKQVPGAAVNHIIQLFIAHKSPADGMLPSLLKLAISADAAAALAATFAMPARRTASPDEVSFGGVRTTLGMMSGQQTEHKNKLQVTEPLEAFALVKAALQHRNAEAFVQLAVLCHTLPVALPQHAVADLIHTAIQMQDRSITVICMKLTGTQTLPAEQLAPLLLLAVQLRNYIAAYDLLQLPGAAALDTAAVLQLLETAIEGQAGEQLVRSLLALEEACSGIASDSAAALLTSSLCNGPDFKVLTALLEQLPAAALAEVQPHKFAHVLARAVMKCKLDDEDSLEAVEQLVESPAAGSLDASEVCTVLIAAAQYKRAELLTLLCELPTAEQLSPGQLYEVMWQALLHSRKTAARALCDLCRQLSLVAVQMQPQQVSKVAYAVVQLAGSKEAAGDVSAILDALEGLVYLPGMQGIPVDDLNWLVNACFTQLGESDDKLCSVLTVLLTAPSAQQLEQQQTGLLLSAAITRQLYGCMALLLQLPAAQEMGADDGFTLLMALLQHMRSCEHFKAAEEVYTQLLMLPALQHCTDHDMFHPCVSEVVHLPQQLQHESGTADAEGSLYVVQRHVVWLEQLLALPAVGIITIEAGDEMLRYTLQLCPAAAKVLCSKVPALQQLETPVIVARLTSAVGCPEQAMQESGSCSSETAIGCLYALPGAQQLQPQALQMLLQAALLQDRPTAFECLASVKGQAAGIGRKVLLDLLLTAVRTRSCKVSVG
jgi:hypothetical protein